MTLEKRVKALEGQAQRETDDTQTAQGAALFRAKMDALRATTPPTPPCSPEESEEGMRALQEYLKALTEPSGKGV